MPDKFMFLTFDHAEVPMGALVRGGHSWRYVEYPTTYPWFHVALIEFDGAEHGFYPISTDGLKRAENFKSCRATLRRIRGL